MNATSERLAERLAYRFRKPALMTEALQHRSFVQENPLAGRHDNERLEFLGDAVLALATSQLLMERFPEMHEGELSRLRARLVNAGHLAQAARALDLGPALRLGRGEDLSGGRDKDSILAGALEALIAAVYLDGGLQAARAVIETHLAAGDLQAAGPIAADSKSRLQEAFPGSGPDAPHYILVMESGPGHHKTFTVRVEAGRWAAEGSGRSKKAAEQEAARRLLEGLPGKL